MQTHTVHIHNCYPVYTTTTHTAPCCVYIRRHLGVGAMGRIYFVLIKGHEFLWRKQLFQSNHPVNPAALRSSRREERLAFKNRPGRDLLRALPPPFPPSPLLLSSSRVQHAASRGAITRFAPMSRLTSFCCLS